MWPGDVIDGKYQIEAELGEGGMGRVVAASHLALGSTVAIKVLKADAMKFPEVPRRFMREARAAGRLRSEHVVKVVDVGQLATGEPYMVMEMLHGADLAARLKQGPVPPALAAEYIAQACEGLAEAHALGMVHRDVKPANLFVASRPNGAPLVKVLDFGIATAATGDVDHNLTSTLTVIGSPSYMSPEQLRAAKDVDARSDIWSLGVTLYELVSGRQPFVGPTLTALTLKIVGEPHEPLAGPGVSPVLAEIVDRCLAKDREDRFANVAQLAEALAPLFPNGRVAAEMVAGSLSQPVAPTLLGMESAVAVAVPAKAGTVRYRGAPSSGVVAKATPVAAIAATPNPATTTDFSAGESAPMRPSQRRRAVWIAVGGVAAAGILATGIVLSQRSTSNAAAVAPSPVPSPVVESITPAPVVTPPPAPAPPPAPVPVPVPAVVTPAAPVKKLAPSSVRPPAPKRDPRAPVEPPDYTKDPVKEPTKEPPKPLVKEPSLTDPPVTDPPVKDPAPVKDPPAKQPCAPSDPRCGL